MPIAIKDLPSADMLRSMFRYDAEAGRLFWVMQPWRQKPMVGSEAGTENIFRGEKRRVVQISGTRFKAHRIIWKMMTGDDPSEFIDHINGDPLDNRWANLRAATHSENQRNQRVHKNNKVGLKGVRFVKRRQCFEATITHKRKTKWLGYFRSKDEAHAAYVLAAKEMYGAFARAA
ncbi:MAG: hypothetical protein JWL86_794 [Rhizobium sp.]|nr:hypothetical protein [Rhizobium sp.]